MPKKTPAAESTPTPEQASLKRRYDSASPEVQALWDRIVAENAKNYVPPLDKEFWTWFRDELSRFNAEVRREKDITIEGYFSENPIIGYPDRAQEVLSTLYLIRTTRKNHMDRMTARVEHKLREMGYL